MAQRTKGAWTEAELKDAARRLLVSKTYAEIKVTDITAEAGKAAGVFYRYFTDKDALLRTLAADFEQALHAVVVDHLGNNHVEHGRGHPAARRSRSGGHTPTGCRNGVASCRRRC